eukprot:SAG22_NODE_1914_length_3320_cov_3.030418_4_plen_73_part_00
MQQDHSSLERLFELEDKAFWLCVKALHTELLQCGLGIRWGIAGKGRQLDNLDKFLHGVYREDVHGKLTISWI